MDEKVTFFNMSIALTLYFLLVLYTFLITICNLYIKLIISNGTNVLKIKKGIDYSEKMSLKDITSSQVLLLFITDIKVNFFLVEDLLINEFPFTNNIYCWIKPAITEAI